jgi:hypothetical protein
LPLKYIDASLLTPRPDIPAGEVRSLYEDNLLHKGISQGIWSPLAPSHSHSSRSHSRPDVPRHPKCRLVTNKGSLWHRHFHGEWTPIRSTSSIEREVCCLSSLSHSKQFRFLDHRFALMPFPPCWSVDLETLYMTASRSWLLELTYPLLILLPIILGN